MQARRNTEIAIGVVGRVMVKVGLGVVFSLCSSSWAYYSGSFMRHIKPCQLREEFLGGPVGSGVVDGAQEAVVRAVEILGTLHLHILENDTITANKRAGGQDSGLVRQLVQLQDTWLAIGANSSNSRYLHEEVDGLEEEIVAVMTRRLDGVGRVQAPLQDMKVLGSDLLQEDRFCLDPQGWKLAL
jgi:hypothetical protein